MLDSFSIHRIPFAVDTSQQILDNSSTTNSRVLKLDTSWSIELYVFLYIRFNAIFSHFSPIFLDKKSYLPLPKQFTSHSSSSPLILRSNPCIFTLVWSSFYPLIIHFMHSDLTFGVFENFWGFSKLMKYLWNFWDGFCLNEFKSSCIASHLHYNNVSCILDVYLLCWIVVCC